jgi:hypothetical protein
MRRLPLCGERMLNGLVLLGLLVIALRAMPVAAAPCLVPSSAYPHIQDAVNATTCATIDVAAGIYFEHVTIGRDVTLRGDGQDVTVVDGSDSGQVFVISQGSDNATFFCIDPNTFYSVVVEPGEQLTYYINLGYQCTIIHHNEPYFCTNNADPRDSVIVYGGTQVSLYIQLGYTCRHIQ